MTLADRPETAGGRARASRERVLELLRATARHFESAERVADFFGGITETLAAMVEAERVVFWLLDRETSILTAQERAYGFPSEVLTRLTNVPWPPGGEDASDPIVHHSAVFGRPPPGETRLDPYHALVDAAGVREVLMAPWRAGDGHLGLVAACDSRRPGGFTHEDAWVLRAAGLAAGLVWQGKQAELRERAAAAEENRRVHELTLMQQASRALTSTLDLQVIGTAVARATAMIVSPAEVSPRRASLLRLEGDRLRLLAEYDPEGPPLSSGSWNQAQYAELLAELETGKPRPGVFTVDGEMPEVIRDLASRVGLTGMAMVALNVGGEPFGVLSVGVRDGSRFTEGQLRGIETIANLAELAIFNAMHFETARREAAHMAQLEETKSKFLRLASHELRGPVAVLRGYLSMLQDGTFDRREELRGVYAVMAGKAAQMEMLVTQMLEAARLDEGRLRLRFEPLDLRSAVREAFATVRLTVGSSHQLRLGEPDEPVPVVGDAWRLTTIVSNLLDNAVKYSPAGGSVWCELRLEGDSAVVEVRDRGLGIAARDMPTLFTRFGRIVTPENSHIAGTGLGLYLCRELAHMHEGDLDAVSIEGVGSAFRLRLPLQPPDQEQVSPEADLGRVFDAS